MEKMKRLLSLLLVLATLLPNLMTIAMAQTEEIALEVAEEVTEIVEEEVFEEIAEEIPEEDLFPVYEEETAQNDIETVVLSEVASTSSSAANAEVDSDEDMTIIGLYLTEAGDASLIRSDDRWLLIDAGDEACADELIGKIRAYGIEELDVLISHVHTDHVGGFAALMDCEDITINHLYLPDASLTPYYEHTDTFLNRLTRAAQSNNSDVQIISLEKGSTFCVGDVMATVLGPVADVSPDKFTATENQTAEEKYVNCRSLTVRFDCGDVSFLSAGDIEEQEELKLLDEYGSTGELDVDIMKLSHHGLPTSNLESFVDAVSPRYSYALNSGKTFPADSKYRLYYNSCHNASQYGPVYLVGDEKEDFSAQVVNGDIKIFKGDTELKGLVSLTGGDGSEVTTYKYYITGGIVEEGVYTIDGKKYYISQGGFVYKAYYVHDKNNPDGGKYIYKVPVEGGPVRYVDEEGVLYTGFRKVNDYYRYFDTKTGIMATGDENFTPVSINGKKYAINESGVIYNYGAKSGDWKSYGSNYRYFDTKGVMATGWLTVGEKKYYMDPGTGLRTIGLKKIDGKTYYFVETNNAGYAWCDGLKTFGKDYRYFESDGVMTTGFKKVNGYYRYFDSETGLMVKGDKNYSPVSINSKKYAINESGVIYNYGAKSGAWKAYGSNYRYFDTKGVMATGWTTVSGVKYYLDPSTGLRYTGFAKDGSKYYYVENGKRSSKTGFVKYDGEYYQIKKGARVSTDTYEKCGSAYVKLSATEYTYNGKAKKPSVTVYSSSGSKLSSGKYTVKYASGRKNVGKYTVTVTLKGGYSGSKKLYFKINPVPAEIDSISAGSGSLKVKLEKKSTQVTGYQIQYSTSKSFSSATTKTISSYKTTSKTLSGLKSGKTYYVRVRTYKTVDGTKYYSPWSDYVSKKTK